MKPGLYAVTRWPNANEWPDDTSRVLMQEEDTAADRLAEFFAQASPEEAEEQARSDGWRP